MIQVVFAGRSELCNDWVNIAPITQTGASVRTSEDNWIEVVKVALEWVRMQDVLVLDYDKEMVEGRYLYVDTHFRRAVYLNGYHTYYKGEKYYLLAKDDGDKRVNMGFQYSMVPAKDLYKINE
jgi:hypothetical protein